MKSKVSCVVAVCFILGLLPWAVNGQEAEKRYQMLLVIDEVVKPSMQKEYSEAGKKWIAFMKDHEFLLPVNTYWTGDNHVYWVMPIQNFAEIDKLMEQSNKFIEEFPDDYTAVMDAFKGTSETSRMCVYMMDYKYSMIAEEEGESEEENFVFFDIYYCEPGTDVEIIKLWDEWKAFLADKEIVQNWAFYWGMMGTDSPMIVLAASAKNAREFYEENAKMWQALGKEAGTYVQRMMKYVTKQEQKTGWYQKALSYTPVKKEE